MAPFILDKALEPDGDDFVIRVSRAEVEAMGLAGGAKIQVHLTAPHAAWERIGGLDEEQAAKLRQYQSSF